MDFEEKKALVRALVAQVIIFGQPLAGGPTGSLPGAYRGSLPCGNRYRGSTYSRNQSITRLDILRFRVG